MQTAGGSLRAVVDRLARHYGKPPAPLRDAWHLILWDNVCYLANDDKRAAAFALLKQTVGLKPEQILSAPLARLRVVTAHGVLADKFAAKLREAARLAIAECEGDVDAFIRKTPDRAHRTLRKFPGIGEPGADRIMLFAGLVRTLAPESNGLRVLTRLGTCVEHKSYGATYKASQLVTARELSRDARALTAAHLLLRRHGQETCTRTSPACDRCPVRHQCAFAVAHNVSA